MLRRNSGGEAKMFERLNCSWHGGENTLLSLCNRRIIGYFDNLVHASDRTLNEKDRDRYSINQVCPGGVIYSDVAK